MLIVDVPPLCWPSSAKRNRTRHARWLSSLGSGAAWGVALPHSGLAAHVVTVPPGESQPTSDLGPSVLSQPPFCMHPSHHLVSHNPPFPSRAADLLRDGAGAAGRDRGERRAGGRRTVSAAPEACHPGWVGRRDCSSPLLRACCGLRRWTMPGALYCPRCRPHPALTSPRVHRWARGVAPATFRRHRRLRRSARGRRGGVELRSASRPRRDARRRCARCARFRNSSP